MPKKALRTLRSILLIVVTAFVLIAVYQHFFPSPPRVQLPEEMLLNKQDRILVIAPHCDDETLGAGGLIARAHQEGAQVHVVVITNGDGFAFAAAGQGRTLLPTPSDYIRLAYQRQNESFTALNRLGLPAGNLIFLGYPDRGIAPMWRVNWTEDNPYFSRFTQLTHSPYFNSYRSNVVYCGENLVSDLSSLLTDLQPTIIVLPHPNDAHSDHWATFNFVTYAIQQLRSQNIPFTETVREYGYLVHRGDWPAPKGLLPARELLPPTPLLSTAYRWIKFPLGEMGAWNKYLAINQYRSQVTYMRRYLVSFARVNELFAPVNSRSVALLPPASEVAQAEEAAWQEISPVIIDPRSDTLTRRLFGSADLSALRAATDGKTLFLRLETYHPVSTRTQYSIFLRPIDRDGAAQELPPPFPESRTPSTGHAAELHVTIRAYGSAVVHQANTAARDLPLHTSTAALQVDIPLAELGRPNMLFVGAESRLLGTVDRLAWTLIQLPLRHPEPRSYSPTPEQEEPPR